MICNTLTNSPTNSSDWLSQATHTTNWQNSNGSERDWNDVFHARATFAKKRIKQTVWIRFSKLVIVARFSSVRFNSIRSKQNTTPIKPLARYATRTRSLALSDSLELALQLKLTWRDAFIVRGRLDESANLRAFNSLVKRFRSSQLFERFDTSNPNRTKLN